MIFYNVPVPLFAHPFFPFIVPVPPLIHNLLLTSLTVFLCWICLPPLQIHQDLSDPTPGNKVFELFLLLRSSLLQPCVRYIQPRHDSDLNYFKLMWEIETFCLLMACPRKTTLNLFFFFLNYIHTDQ